MIDQPLENNVPQVEPDNLEVYELKERISELEEKLEFATHVADLAETYLSNKAYISYCNDVEKLKEQNK